MAELQPKKHNSILWVPFSNVVPSISDLMLTNSIAVYCLKLNAYFQRQLQFLLRPNTWLFFTSRYANDWPQFFPGVLSPKQGSAGSHCEDFLSLCWHWTPSGLFSPEGSQQAPPERARAKPRAAVPKVWPLEQAARVAHVVLSNAGSQPHPRSTEPKFAF